MDVKYSEKMYEIYFNIEIGRKTNVIFPPGQVQEGVLGFDNAVFYAILSSPWDKLWPHSTPSVGIDLTRLAGHMEKTFGRTVGSVGKMKCNLFFQYKKPDYLTTALASEWWKWCEPYFRYRIDTEQLVSLLEIEKYCVGRALVLYAAPAIKSIDDLTVSFQKGRVIHDSNYQTADKLRNHECNTYTAAGTHSYAHSDPENLHNFDLYAFLKENDVVDTKKRENNFNSNNLEYNIKFIYDTALGIDKISKNSDFRETYSYWSAGYSDLRENYPLYWSLSTLHLYKKLTNIQWLVI